MNIIEAINDPRFFRPLFKNHETWHSWEVFLSALFGLPIEEKKDQKLFRKCTGKAIRPRQPAREAYAICGRRSGKSFISSVIAIYLAIFKDWNPYLQVGETGYIFIIASDKKQAQIIKSYVSGILNSRPSFRRMIEADLTWEIRLKNSTAIAVKAADFRTLRGYTLLATICEEISFWRDEFSSNPAEEIIRAIRPSLAAIPDSLLLGISTPYSKSGILYESYRKYFGKAEGLVWKADTRTMNPTIPREVIKRALRDDPSSGRSEWMAEFREDIESFLSPELIEEVVVKNRIELPRLKNVEYFGFIDPSGGRGDSFALAISHKDKKSKKIVLDLIREVRPPFQPSEVVRDYSEVLKQYNIYEIQSDRYAGEWVTEAFRKNEILVTPCAVSTSELYLSFLPVISNRNIELLDNQRLARQLASLERRTRSGGKDLISHATQRQHDDLCAAVAGTVYLASCAESEPLPPPSLGYFEDDINPRSVDVGYGPRIPLEIYNWLIGLEPDGTQRFLDDLRRQKEEMEIEEINDLPDY